MKDPFEQLTTVSKTVRLTEAERLEGRQQLVKRMAMPNPVRRSLRERISGLFTSIQPMLLSFTSRTFVSAMVVMVLLFVLGTGTSLASAGSVPGDALYPVKIANEKLRAAVTISEQAKIRFEVQRAERRIEEAERLASEGRLDAATQVKLEADFNTHVTRVHNELATLEKTNDAAADDVRTNIEASLRVHERTLTKLASQDEKKRRKVNKANDQAAETLRTKIANEVMVVSQQRVKAAERVKAQDEKQVAIATERRQRAAERAIAATQQVIERLQKRGVASLEAEARLGMAQQKLVLGIAATEQTTKFDLFGEAQQIAQEAKQLAIVNSRLRLDLKAESTDDNGTIEVNSKIPSLLPN